MTITSNLGSKLGAGLSFILFLTTGLLPSIVYGGYMGLTLSRIMFGHDTSWEMWARFMTGGGMILGIIAVMSLFLVMGALIGGVLGHIYARYVQRHIQIESSNVIAPAKSQNKL